MLFGRGRSRLLARMNHAFERFREAWAGPQGLAAKMGRRDAYGRPGLRPG
jgi:hypothetical protein